MYIARTAVLVLSSLLPPLTYAAESAPGQTAAQPAAPRTSIVTTRPVGPPAKNFTVTSIKGKKISFPGDYKGKMVLVTFWATWCPACRAEVNTLRMAYARYHRKGLEIIGISADASKKRSQEQLAQFVKQNGIVWEQVYSGVDPIESLYKIGEYPTSFLVDGTSGRIVALREALHTKQLLKTLERLMGPPGTATTSRPATPLVNAK